MGKFQSILHSGLIPTSIRIILCCFADSKVSVRNMHEYPYQQLNLVIKEDVQAA